MSNSNLSILVIGGAGYIGSHVVLELCDNGYDVTVFDNLSSGYRINVDRRAVFIKGDIMDSNDLNSLFYKEYDAVFHFAAKKAAGESMMKPEIYATTNINGTINILNQMVKNNIKYFIFSSTAAVYGMPEYLPVDEKHPLNPINFYGFTKIEIERTLHWYSNLKDICFGTLRYFNAAGYDIKGRIQCVEKNPENLLPIVMETVSGKRDIMEVYGDDYDTCDGTGIRDYIHVNDLASAHVKTLSALVKNRINITINLATGKGYSVMEVIQNTNTITGKKVNFNIVERRVGDPAALVSISKLAHDMIDWECKYSDIKIILQSMWEIYSKY